MIKIRLCCVTGMLSSQLVTKIKDAAKLRQIEIDIDSLAISTVKEDINKEHIDIILLGPHMEYKLKQIKNLCDQYKIALGMITTQDYGFMNGDSILTHALDLAEKSKAYFDNLNAGKNANQNSKASKKQPIEETAVHSDTIVTPVENSTTCSDISSDKIYNTSETSNIVSEESNYNTKAINSNTKSSLITDKVNTIEYTFKNISATINNDKGVDTMIKKVKELLLNTEKEVYMSTNIDINEFEEEFNEISQKGVKVTVVASDKYNYDGIQIDKLYVYSTEKIKNMKPKMTVVVDNQIALVSEPNPSSENEINFTTTDNHILVDSIARNVDNYIYVLKLRDNIDFKLRDI